LALKKAGFVPGSAMHATNQAPPRFLRSRQALTVSLLFGGYAALYFCRADLSVGAPRILSRHVV
jgi:hypothetical protein